MENWFEFFKDRRFVPVFFITLVALVLGAAGLALLLQIAESNDLLKYWPFVAAIILVVLAVIITREVVRAQARRRNRYKHSPLSRDELTKARSKLMKQ